MSGIIAWIMAFEERHMSLGKVASNNYETPGKEAVQEKGVSVYLLKMLPLLMLCQCASHEVTIEQRGLLAQERSNDKERSKKYVKQRNQVRKHLVRLMIKNKNDPFPLKKVNYPSDNVSETEKIAINIYNEIITKFPKGKYTKMLVNLKFLADHRKEDN